MPLEIKPNERGFGRAEFKDRYQAICSIQESSLVEEACIWLGVLTTTEGFGNDRMHLTQAMVADLIPLLQTFVDTGKLVAPTKPPNLIPPMTDPLGAHWRQPADIRDAPIDDETVVLTRRQFEELSEYSTSMPSGVYPGNCWRGEIFEETARGWRPTGRWMLRWCGEVEGRPDLCSNNQREILIVG